MRSIGLGLVFATSMGLVSATASADDRLQSSFTGLVAKGFEVKSVTLIPLDVAKRVTDKVRTDNVVVTLQKNEAVAVCYVAFANWAFMNKASLDSPTLCEVRSAATEESAAPPSCTKLDLEHGTTDGSGTVQQRDASGCSAIKCAGTRYPHSLMISGTRQRRFAICEYRLQPRRRKVQKRSELQRQQSVATVHEAYRCGRRLETAQAR